MKRLFSFATAAALITLSLSTAHSEVEGQASDTITYLGVSTFHLSPSLREHLEIMDGFGVQVLEVVADSPAEEADLRKNDILLKFKDQLLISPEHLSLLVRNEEDSSTVPLTLIRKGTETQVEVTLGKIEQSAPQIRRNHEDRRMSPEQWQDHLKSQQDYWEKWMNDRQTRREREASGPGNEAEREIVTGRPPAVSVTPGFPVRVFGTEGVLKIDNEQGEVSITHEGDGHRIQIKDADGREIYQGPYDADLGVEGLPEEARNHLNKMKLDNLELLTPRAIEEAPEKTSSPMPPPTGTPEEELL